MKVGVIATSSELGTWLTRIVGGGGHTAFLSSDFPSALAAGPGVLFVEWPLDQDSAWLITGLQETITRTPPVAAIVLVPFGSSAMAQRARHNGASDVLFIPPDESEVIAEIEELAALESGVGTTSHPLREFLATNLLGHSTNFNRSLYELKCAIRSEANILLEGETGTGKELFSMAIHRFGRRSSRPFLAINCASLPGQLLESELFGHVRGSFTGADREREGRFEAVGDGTLLLDEVGELEPYLQMKLLRVIEQREFQRVGENRNRPFRARLVAATSVDLEKAMAQNRFRRDLFGRLNQIRIKLPPLRERRDDIPLLARHFLAKHAPSQDLRLSPTALEILVQFDFPMNIRQLENALVGAIARLENGAMILPKHLPEEVRRPREATPTPTHALSIPRHLAYAEARDAALRSIDAIYLKDLLERCGGNQSEAARQAGIDRKTFASRIGLALESD